MTIEQFIEKNCVAIDAHIREVGGFTGSLDNNDREEWIDNDPFLYGWAQSEGVEECQ